MIIVNSGCGSRTRRQVRCRLRTNGILPPNPHWSIYLDHREYLSRIEVRNQTAKTFDAGVVFKKGEKLNSLVLPDLRLAVSLIFGGHSITEPRSGSDRVSND
ncbi:hypothetical protein BH18ACI4_BH18ACI4_18590 [soil metagenome]